jgi:hypothetical protein
MTINTVSKDVKTSKAVKQVHSVEKLIAEKLEQKENLRKKVIDTVEMKERQEVTRGLVKKLFQCTSHEQIDAVIYEADVHTIAHAYEYGGTTDFALRIQNAERQVRKLIDAGYDLSRINPVKEAFPVYSRDCISLVDSWGHLADKLMKGFALKL